jgi:integrase
MYACGLRIGEATTLEIRSIDRANQVLRIIGKGDKERLVLLPQPVLDELGTLWRTHTSLKYTLHYQAFTPVSAAEWHYIRVVGGQRVCFWTPPGAGSMARAS